MTVLIDAVDKLRNNIEIMLRAAKRYKAETGKDSPATVLLEYIRDEALVPLVIQHYLNDDRKEAAAQMIENVSRKSPPDAAYFISHAYMKVLGKDEKRKADHVVDEPGRIEVITCTAKGKDGSRRMAHCVVNEQTGEVGEIQWADEGAVTGYDRFLDAVKYRG